jgi:CRP-like cAMP-binding protein
MIFLNLDQFLPKIELVFVSMKNLTVTNADLDTIYLFKVLNDEQCTRILTNAQRIHMKNEDVLFKHGDIASRFYFLKNGQITLGRISKEGNEKILEIIQAGQTFAEAVMFMEGNKYPVTATSVGASEVLAFDNNTYLDLLRESTDTCFALMADMAQRLKGLINEVDNLTLQDAQCRLVNYILVQLPEEKTNPVEVNLPIAKNVIASRLSIKPETFSRIMHKLSEEGLISIDGRKILIHDIDGLNQYVGM